MTSPKISVVVPSFNKGDYIGQTLKSIFDQNYPNLEVIVQDGGSTDGSLNVIKKYAAKHPKLIKWESKKDKGQLDGINKGLAKASGDLLTFINPDDLYDKGTFRLIAEAYKKAPESLWFAGYGKIIDEKGREVAGFWSWIKNLLLDLNSYFLLLATANYLVQPSIFVNREAYKKYGPFTGMGKYVFEYELWLKVGRVSMPTVVHKNLSKFRTGGVNMSSLFAKTTFKKDLEVTRKYSKSEVVVFLHWLNNSLRLLVNRFV